MKGIYFEDFAIDEELEVAKKTVTEADVVLFTGITEMFNPLFVDESFAKESRFGRRIVPGILTLGTAIGITEWMIHGTVVALLGVDKVRFLKPLFFGETVEVHTKPLEKRLSHSNNNAGIVHFLNDVYVVERKEKILQFERDILIYRRESAYA